MIPMPMYNQICLSVFPLLNLFIAWCMIRSSHAIASVLTIIICRSMPLRLLVNQDSPHSKIQSTIQLKVKLTLSETVHYDHPDIPFLSGCSKVLPPHPGPRLGETHLVTKANRNWPFRPVWSPANNNGSRLVNQALEVPVANLIQFNKGSSIELLIFSIIQANFGSPPHI